MTITKIAIALLTTTAIIAAGEPRQAQINSGTNTGVTGIKIALPEFPVVSADAKTAALAAVFNKVLWDDLDYAGGLTLVSRSFYPLGKFSGPADIKPDDWTNAGIDAQLIAFGNVQAGNGGMAVEARLWDLKATQNRELLPGQRFRSDDTEEGARMIAHRFADAIVRSISGTPGIAQTYIAYICERTVGVKELCMMDYDGHAAQSLTGYKSTVLTPAWSPDGEKIAFTSYRRGTPDIEVLSRIDRRPYTFERAGGTTITPAWSPDGSKIAFATSRDGSHTQIYVADWNGKNMRRVTVSKSVDVSPVWSPTGREIAFVSDRSGSPQIYVMDAEGTNVRRLIDEGGQAVNPSWSPDGRSIAFAWLKSRTSNFDIYIHDLGTGRNTQMTQNAGDNEKPTWSPDGRHVAFESSRTGSRQKQIFSMLVDGSKIRQLTNSGNNTGPAWSGFNKENR